MSEDGDNLDFEVFEMSDEDMEKFRDFMDETNNLILMKLKEMAELPPVMNNMRKENE